MSIVPLRASPPADEEDKSTSAIGTTSTLRVLYRNEDRLSLADFEEVVRAADDENGGRSKELVRYEHGLCSEVYVFTRPNDERQASCSKPNFTDRLLIKRVTREEQRRPHSVDEEIRLLAKLNHPGIVKIHGAYEDTRCPFSSIVNVILDRGLCDLADLYANTAFTPFGHAMQDDPAATRANRSDGVWRELFATAAVNGVSVGGGGGGGGGGEGEEIGRASRWLECVMALAQDTLEAIRYLHDVANVAHRDIKPSNIVLFPSSSSSRKGNGMSLLRPVLIDFGTAQDNVAAREGSSGKGQNSDRGTIKQESNVGTGAYRAPETLFAPSEGYDAFKVDLWEWATTVAEAFLPLEAVMEADIDEDENGYFSDSEEEGVEPGERHATALLEKALWADDNGESWSDAQLPKQAKESLSWQLDAAKVCGDNKRKQTIKTFRRKQLFEGSRGDLGLAASIFSLRELPPATKEGEEQWPESVKFQPPLRKMPFVRRTPDPGGLRVQIEPVFSQLMQNTTVTASQKRRLEGGLVELLDSCLQLSASRRPTASQAVQALSQEHPIQ